MLYTTHSKKKINIISLDFDGCIFHRGYIESDDKQRLINLNQVLFTHINEQVERHGYSAIVLMVGSNRQSFTIDMMNFFGKGSCFSALEKLSEYIQRINDKIVVTVDGYLLADTYGQLTPGTSFNSAKLACLPSSDSTFVTTNHADWLFDKSKLSILYAQMHRAAVDNPDCKIDYDFYDDRYDILSELINLFEEHSDLIPSNVTLRIHQYHHATLEVLAEISSSKGVIDRCYHDTVKLMARVCGVNIDNLNPNEEVNIKELMGQNNAMAVFKQQRCLSMADSHNKHAVSKGAVSKSNKKDDLAIQELATDVSTLSIGSDAIVKKAPPEKLYIKPILAKEFIAKQKREAWENFVEHVDAAQDFKSLYAIFLDITVNKENILRAHRLNWIHPYGDTETYKMAVDAIYKATSRLSPQSLKEFLDLKKILEEFKSCYPEQYKDMDVIKICKSAALEYIVMKLRNAKNISEVFGLFEEVKQPYNIIRLHRRNIVFKEGMTDSYRKAILSIADKATVLKDQVITDVQKEDICTLIDTLEACKIDKSEVRDIICRLHTCCELQGRKVELQY